MHLDGYVLRSAMHHRVLVIILSLLLTRRPYSARKRRENDDSGRELIQAGPRGSIDRYRYQINYTLYSYGVTDSQLRVKLKVYGALA